MIFAHEKLSAICVSRYPRVHCLTSSHVRAGEARGWTPQLKRTFITENLHYICGKWRNDKLLFCSVWFLFTSILYHPVNAKTFDTDLVCCCHIINRPSNSYVNLFWKSYTFYQFRFSVRDKRCPDPWGKKIIELRFPQFMKCRVTSSYQFGEISSYEWMIPILF